MGPQQTVEKSWLHRVGIQKRKFSLSPTKGWVGKAITFKSERAPFLHSLPVRCVDILGGSNRHRAAIAWSKKKPAKIRLLCPKLHGWFTFCKETCRNVKSILAYENISIYEMHTAANRSTYASKPGIKETNIYRQEHWMASPRFLWSMTSLLILPTIWWWPTWETLHKSWCQPYIEPGRMMLTRCRELEKVTSDIVLTNTRTIHNNGSQNLRTDNQKMYKHYDQAPW